MARRRPVEDSRRIRNESDIWATCSPSTAQFVKNLNAKKFVNEFPRAVERLHRGRGHSSRQGSKTDHKHAGFTISKWISNSKKVMSVLHAPLTAQQKNLNLTDSSTTTVLGMQWRDDTNTFTYSLQSSDLLVKGTTIEKSSTKREVLRNFMSIIDPLGLIAHFLIHIKILLQEVWRSGTGWDENLKDEELSEWQRWARLIWQVESV